MPVLSEHFCELPSMVAAVFLMAGWPISPGSPQKSGMQCRPTPKNKLNVLINLAIDSIALGIKHLVYLSDADHGSMMVRRGIAPILASEARKWLEL